MGYLAGVSVKQNQATLENNTPHVAVGTPGRVLDLVNKKFMKLDKLKHFVLDECDRMLEELDMRADVQKIFQATPHQKQVMLYSATLSKPIRVVCKKFCQDVSAAIPTPSMPSAAAA